MLPALIIDVGVMKYSPQQIRANSSQLLVIKLQSRFFPPFSYSLAMRMISSSFFSEGTRQLIPLGVNYCARVEINVHWSSFNLIFVEPIFTNFEFAMWISSVEVNNVSPYDTTVSPSARLTCLMSAFCWMGSAIRSTFSLIFFIHCDVPPPKHDFLGEKSAFAEKQPKS
jgi:hypothetical protein